MWATGKASMQATLGTSSHPRHRRHEAHPTAEFASGAYSTAFSGVWFIPYSALSWKGFSLCTALRTLLPPFCSSIVAMPREDGGSLQGFGVRAENCWAPSAPGMEWESFFLECIVFYFSLVFT